MRSKQPASYVGRCRMPDRPEVRVERCYAAPQAGQHALARITAGYPCTYSVYAHHALAQIIYSAISSVGAMRLDDAAYKFDAVAHGLDIDFVGMQLKSELGKNSLSLADDSQYSGFRSDNGEVINKLHRR